MDNAGRWQILWITKYFPWVEKYDKSKPWLYRHEWMADSWQLLHVIQLLVLFIILILAILWYTRRRTYLSLRRCGLPTVFWRPKFVHYQESDDVDTDRPKKLSSSTITNILPRMQRLNGPFGMYGTVYGVSTAVVHVAHPVPALALLGASTHAIVVADPANKKSWFTSQVFTKSNSSTTAPTTTGIAKAPAYDHFKNFCGEGVFTADGDDWKQKRAAVLHALLRNGKTPFHDRLEEEAHIAGDQLVQKIHRLLSLSSSNITTKHPSYPLSCRVNLVPLLQLSTIGLIYRYITHTKLSMAEVDDLDNYDNHTIDTEGISDTESLSSNEDEQPKQHRKDAAFMALYLKSLTRIRMIILAQSRSIWFLLPRWCYRYFANLYRDEEFTMIPVRQMAAKACREARPHSPLAQLQSLPLYSTKSESNSSFSPNLISEAITLLFAGQDTSAATLSWTLHLLTLHPHVQQKLAEEVRSVLGHPKTEDEIRINKKSMAKMVYLDAVIKESMRLYPVAPFVVRKVGGNVTLKRQIDHESELVTLPSGSLACIWIYSLHRHPEFWSRPDDFVPERWLAPYDSGKDRGIGEPGVYIPFAAGPRNCVGQPLANIILRSLLARLILHYEFQDERVEDQFQRNLDSSEWERKLRKDMQAGFTVLPQGGLYLNIRHRN
jgi:cytochrome P450